MRLLCSYNLLVGVRKLNSDMELILRKLANCLYIPYK